VSSGEDCIIVFWNYVTMEETIVMHSQNGIPNHMAFDLEIGVMMTSGTQHNVIQLWDINAQRVVSRLDVNYNQVILNNF
jgi:hypothetical protein